MSLNSICPYLTIFPLEFPIHHLKNIKNGWVFDPFCGRGTTLFAARMLGLSAIGMDVNPVAVAISRAKLANSTPKRIVSLAEKLLISKPDSAPEGKFWRLAFHPETLDHILRLKQGLAHLKGETATALRAIILGALHGRVPKVRFWLKRHLSPKKAPVLDIIKERAIRYFGSSLPKGRGKVFTKDAQTPVKFPIKFDAIICSPPYFGMNSYLADQWLRNWFLGGADKPIHIDPKQISMGTQEKFIKNLSKVWNNVAHCAKPSAPLIIRFGSLPAKKSDPEAMIVTSMKETR